MESVQKLETRYPPKLDSLLPENTQEAEEFSIEDLLDFSNDEIFQLHDDEEQQQKEEDPPQHHKIVSSPQNYAAVNENSSVADDFSSISVLEEDLENLKWLSQFVEDSFCEYSLTYPPTKLSEPVQERDILVTPVQTKARSKRTRSGSHAWPAVKKNDDSRRCSHCGVQKTPQWRAGPLGSKTLCNACGVRFKSGRLFPEYRPACSPTFSNELHSNSHRKVLEMRRKKEVEIGPAKPVRRFRLKPAS